MSMERDLRGRMVRAGVRHFSAVELLTLGASHHAAGPGHGLNGLPPLDLLGDLVAVAVVADRLREAFGGPLRVLSAYRSPAYNRAIGGAKGSMHLMGKALDLSPVSGRVSDLVAVARRLHSSGTLPGGLGIYGWGVHVDTGYKRLW